jgi:hypothetical protein
MMPSRLRRQCLWMVLAALVVRLSVMAFLYPQQLDPRRDHWAFGYEEGRVARSIVQGKGFGNPLWEGDTGPTAWFAPVYPYFLAVVFRVFGIYTKASAIFILSIQSLFSALTILPIFAIARKSFGELVAVWAGWTWVFFPYAVYWPVGRIWDTWLATLFLSVLFLIVLHMCETTSWRAWIAFGLLSGFAALTNPAVLSVLPFLGLWACWRRHQAKQKWVLRAAGTVLAVIAVVAPWFIRNYRVFHAFVPVRDDMGLELYVGNTSDTLHEMNINAGPWLNETEWGKFQQLGELGYMNEKKQKALGYIRNHPAGYFWLCMRRTVDVWTCFWSFSPRYLQNDPFDPLIVILCTALSALALLGLRVAFRSSITVAVPYAIVLLCFPLVYYFTHLLSWYRRPLDPFFVLLAVYAIVSRRRIAAEANYPAHVGTALLAPSNK